MLKDSFSDANVSIPVFPIQGNHDTWPVNVQDFSTPNSNYAINHLKDSWTSEGWLTEDEYTEFQQYGYYTKPLPFNSKGKVIAVNMQACNNMNWWLFANRNDPGGEIAWLEAQLSQIEQDEGFALVIAHIPSRDCLHEFGLRFHALMDRYQHIVRYSSYGHTHSEEIFLTMGMNSTDPIGFNFLSGSVTSGDSRNPGFSMVEYDEEFMVPLNIHTYYMNLTEANANPSAPLEWNELHDYLDEYRLPDLSPSSIKDLTQRMYDNADLAGLYEYNKAKGGRPYKPGQEHDKSFLCLQGSETFEVKDCFGQPHINLKSKNPTDIFEFLTQYWIKVDN
uniref:Calcineurin-like phosphoesterase domain-containing protein n=1 Tax=Strombidium inclinatum TaxID=197538 RepID=A0A7S3IP58_9SPIT|mmetsp:Transcript_31684/g.48498  ORF Transcript_31684/g.48498 Transcript_31684/m.48498 type:complete len:334 (+) Transcript_31684:946-1947(+)